MCTRSLFVEEMNDTGQEDYTQEGDMHFDNDRKFRSCLGSTNNVEI